MGILLVDGLQIQLATKQLNHGQRPIAMQRVAYSIPNEVRDESYRVGGHSATHKRNTHTNEHLSSAFGTKHANNPRAVQILNSVVKRPISYVNNSK